MKRRRREAQNRVGARLMRIPIADIFGTVVNNGGDRDMALGALAESIARYGLLSPLVVRENIMNGRFQLICGARRLAACRMLGIREIEAYCVEADEQEALRLYMQEHALRALPGCMDAAEAVRRCGLQNEYPRLAMLNRLSERVRMAIRRDRLSLEQAEPLTILRREELQLEAESIIADRQLSAAQARRLVCGPDRGQADCSEMKDVLREIEMLSARLQARGVLGSLAMYSRAGGVCVQILIRKEEKQGTRQESEKTGRII